MTANFTPCPDCEISIPVHAMADHRGDEACVMVQAHTKRLKGLKRSGNTYKTQEKAGVPFTYIAHAFQHDALGFDPTLEYARCSPAWAVWVAECTLLPADERIVVLEHCLEHTVALQSVETVMRLGAFNGQKVKSDAKTQRDRQALRDFLTSLLLLTDNAETE